MSLFKKLFSWGFSREEPEVRANPVEPTLEQFANIIVAEIDSIYPSADTSYLSDKKAIEVTYNSTHCHIYISSIFSDWKALDQLKREEHIRHWIKSSFEQFESEEKSEVNDKINSDTSNDLSDDLNDDFNHDFNNVANRLMLGIRTRTGLEIQQLQKKLDGTEESDETAGEVCVIAGNLMLEFYIDNESLIRATNKEDFDRWEVGLEEVRSIAIANLWKKSDEAYKQIAPGVWQSPWQDSYDSSRILLVDKLRELDVKGDAVVFIPSRDHLFVVGSDDIAALERVVLTSEMVMSQTTRPLTGLPYVISDEGVEVFNPSPEYPAYRLVKRAKYYSAALDYKLQKQLLEKIFKKESIDIFVASYTVKELDTGHLDPVDKDDVPELNDLELNNLELNNLESEEPEHEDPEHDDPEHRDSKSKEQSLTDVGYSSYCVWSEGITSWLPKSEEIVFCQVGKDGQFTAIGTATWEECENQLQKYFHKIESYPERWEVKEFPSGEELSLLTLTDTN